MKKRKKRGILCAIGAALFAVAIPQMDSPEPAEIVMAVVIVLVLAFVAVRSLFPNLRLRKKSKASKAAAAPHQREDSQQQRSFPVASRPLADALRRSRLANRLNLRPLPPLRKPLSSRVSLMWKRFGAESSGSLMLRNTSTMNFMLLALPINPMMARPGGNICAESTAASHRLKIPTRWTCRSAHTCTRKKENPKNRRFPCV